MTDTVSACEKVAAIFEGKQKEGLKDVKFLLFSAETTKEEVCEELLAILEAEGADEYVELDFGDLSWKEEAA